jgi:phenolic acid decarboxylase
MRSRAIEAQKASLKLTPTQRQTVVGVLLGDGCLETQNKGLTYRLKIEQSADHEAYVRHLRTVFGPWVLSGPRRRTRTARTGIPTVSWAFNTVSHAALRFYAQQFYPQGIKRVPRLIHRWLTPRGLAYWFMDDGSIKSRQSKAVIFNTQAFLLPDLERLVGVLESHFQLATKIRRQRDGLQIYVSGASFERFCELVVPHVIPEMRHKLPHPRRTPMPKE